MTAWGKRPRGPYAIAPKSDFPEDYVRAAHVQDFMNWKFGPEVEKKTQEALVDYIMTGAHIRGVHWWYGR